MADRQIDLNSDVGESFGRYKLGLDEDLIPLISSANIACGFHAGDPTVLRRTVVLARDYGVAVGAHPGLPDLMGFGRREMAVTLEEIRDFVTYQIGAIQAFAVAEGVRLQHVKPHGALYNMAVKNPAIWETVAAAMADLDKDLVLFVLGGADRAELHAMGARHGIRIAFEFFADRAYNPDGSLVARSTTGAVIKDHDRAAQRVLQMATEGKVTCIDGSDIALEADTICVHGDNPAALGLVRKIRETLAAAGVDISPPQSFL
ncbi:MAG: 5-oxoprolinase subunit PxpA [Desulfobacterales bacterium]